MKNTKIQTQRQSDGWTDGQTNGHYQTATDGLIGTEINHELKRQKNTNGSVTNGRVRDGKRQTVQNE